MVGNADRYGWRLLVRFMHAAPIEIENESIFALYVAGKSWSGLNLFIAGREVGENPRALPDLYVVAIHQLAGLFQSLAIVRAIPLNSGCRNVTSCLIE
jgi:hypothetical protein